MDRIKQDKRLKAKRRLRELGLFLARLFFIGALFAMLYLVRRFMPGAGGNTAIPGLQVSLGSGEEITLDVPAWKGEPFYTLNGGRPFFDPEKADFQGQEYSSLDSLGRCGPARALLDAHMMTTEEREDMGRICPSGWHQIRYKGIIDSDPPFLYHRCHLIAYSLTGQGANEKDLITGTRYFNVHGMLPFEKEVMDYLWDTDFHVLYRVTPVFEGNELLCRGVIMEAWSVEDRGRSVCFCAFVYNVQPGIVLDYRDGSSRAEN
jgi:DNA-entry nuclease